MGQNYIIFLKYANKISFFGGKVIFFYSESAVVLLFRSVDEGADDEAAEGGVGIGVRIGIAVGFIAVVCVIL